MPVKKVLCRKLQSYLLIKTDLKLTDLINTDLISIRLVEKKSWEGQSKWKWVYKIVGKILIVTKKKTLEKIL